jgi:osmoprotectant transport system ATP-binding protein
MNPADSADPAIEFDHVSFRLSDRPILTDLNLNVRRGETLMLLGRSGSGKTTSLRLINRLADPTSGVVRVEGKPTTVWEAIQLRRHIGYAIQDVGLFPHYIVGKNVAIVPRLLGWPADRISSRVSDVLQLVGLAPNEFARRYPHQLSGGQRQRVGLARALAADPPILLMDEPFGALDPVTRSEIQSEFKRLQQRLRKTVVFVTHDVSEALLLGDRIALIEDGALRGVYAPQQFLTSADEHAQAYAQTFRAIQQIQA